MREWKFWDWVAFGCLWVAALMEAYSVAEHTLHVQLPPLEGIVAIIPLVLLSIATVVLAYRAARGFPTKRSDSLRVDFFPNRADLQHRAGQLQQRIKEASSVDAIWVVGAKFFFSGADTGVVKRLLLPSPESPAFAEFIRTSPHSAAAHDIRNVTEHAKASGTEVRWYRSFISHSIILADSEKPTGWIHLESVLPYSRSDYRPSYTVLKRQSAETVDEIRRIFERMWAEATRC